MEYFLLFHNCLGKGVIKFQVYIKLYKYFIDTTIIYYNIKHVSYTYILTFNRVKWLETLLLTTLLKTKQIILQQIKRDEEEGAWYSHSLSTAAPSWTIVYSGITRANCHGILNLLIFYTCTNLQLLLAIKNIFFEYLNLN